MRGTRGGRHGCSRSEEKEVKVRVPARNRGIWPARLGSGGWLEVGQGKEEARAERTGCSRSGKKG